MSLSQQGPDDLAAEFRHFARRAVLTRETFRSVRLDWASDPNFGAPSYAGGLTCQRPAGHDGGHAWIAPETTRPTDDTTEEA